MPGKFPGILLFVVGINIYITPRILQEITLFRHFNRFIPRRFRNEELEIPVVRLHGAIMSGGSSLRPALSLASTAEVLEKAFTDKYSPAVAISLNSPGGSPVQSRLIYNRIRDLASEHNKRVFIFVEDAAASGGYMIALAGDEIIADASSIVGSIGVVSTSFGFPELLKKIGVERRVYTAGQNKVTLDPFQPEKEEDVERIKSLQLEIHQIFIDMVQMRRGTKLANDPDLFTGLFWTGLKAKELGLIDGIGDMRSFLRKTYGEKLRLKLIEPKRSMLGRKIPGIALSLGNNDDKMASASHLAANLGEGILSVAEEKALWARYGL